MKYEKKERKLFVLNMSVQTSICTLYATPILSFLPSTMPTIFSAEVVRIELIVPLRLIKCLIHGECIMVDSLVLPLAILVKHIHLLRAWVGVDHIQVQALILLEEGTPGGRAPVVVLGDWDDLVHGHIQSLHSAELQSIELKKLSFWIQLHPKDEALISEASLEEEG